MGDRHERIEVIAAGAQGKVHDVWWSFMLRGVLAGVLGLCALFWPSMTLGILARLLGVFLLIDGVAGLFTSLRAVPRGTYLLSAVAGIVIGALLLFWPAGSLRTLLVFVGVWVFVVGISHFLAARGPDVDDAERGLIKTIGIVAAVVGLVLVLWPGAGIVTVSWIIAAAALMLAVLWITLAMRLRRLQQRVSSLR